MSHPLTMHTNVYLYVLHCHHRYDDLSSASDNIDLQTTILSRFDLIFIVRDVPDEQKDQDIAR
jgi:DNA replication licensing factor MCM5